MLKSLTNTSLILAIMAVVSMTGTAHGAKTSWARLFGDSAYKVQAKYEQQTEDGQISQRLKVHVKKGLPLQTLDVTINGVIVGVITTNPAGNGKLVLRTPQSLVPTIVSGDVITVGPLSGVFLSKSGKYKIDGDFAVDGTTVLGHVKYTERLRHGQLDRRFHVSLEGAAAGEVFDVQVNGVSVGTITANEEGEGSFKLRSAAFVHGNGWAAMSNDFPSLQPGDVVTVGIATVTLD